MNNKELILITGATGFIGRFLIDELLKQNYSLRYLVREKSLKKFGQNRGEVITGELSDLDSLTKATKNVKTVIHLAAVLSSKEKDQFQKVNIDGTANLIKACQNNGVGKIVFLSSVYANKQEGHYGRTKFLGEQLIKESGLNYTIIRPNLVFGPQGEGAIRKVVEMLREWPLTIIVGDGQYKRQPVFIQDVTQLIIECLKNPVTNRKIYQIGGPQALTFNQIINILSAKLKVKRLKIHVPYFLIKFVSSLGISSYLSARNLTDFVSDKISNNQAVIKDLDLKLHSLAESINFKRNDN